MSTPLLAGVVLHHGELNDAVQYLKDLRQAEPSLKIYAINNGPAAADDFATAVPSDIKTVSQPINRGYAAAANLGIEMALADGISDVVILPTDGDVSPGALHQLQASARQQDAAIAAPLVLYQGDTQVWARGASFNERWGISRNIDKGNAPPSEPRVRRVNHVTGHDMMLLRCDERSWLRFDERFFLYYEDIDICKAAADRGLDVIVDERVVVHHHKPNRFAYRFRSDQQHHMARSGWMYWAKHVRGFARVTHVIGFTALTLYRLAKSSSYSSFIAGLKGYGAGVRLAVRGRRK